MDPLLSHAVTGLVSASIPLVGAAAVYLRGRAKREESIGKAVEKAVNGMRTDIEQAHSLAKDALNMARDEKKAREATEKRHFDCEKRCDALNGEIVALRAEVRSGHMTRGGR
jgi:Skp family chaperone for outer membrane proteins